MKLFLSVVLLTVSLLSFSQAYDPIAKPNTYRKSDNPNYWKNKMPHPGYWQQDVYYNIKANVDEVTNIIDGNLNLTYWNNSPDDLEYVYFHLYQNAFQPGSYYDNLQRNNNLKPVFGAYEKQGKGTEVAFVKVNGKEMKVELDNTLMKVYLDQPLLAGNSIDFEIDFKTYFDRGSMRRRMNIFRAENGMTHFNGVHWYPRISVYDRKFGWTTDQHLDKEFYGDFGAFDVELTFASNYVVDATGFLLNRDEVLPADLRAKLDIKNFSEKKEPGTPISEITPYKRGETKTWKFHAENVHDFAFTADPTYRIGEAEWNRVKCIALAREANAHRWQNAADYTAKIIQVYSEDIGMYTYHKMIVADAEDGMEYPMLTLDGGGDPGYRGLLCHEIGHNWFFGQIGNNETYRAALDEGFTQFLTAWSLMKIDGDTLVSTIPHAKSNYYNKFKKPDLAIESRVYRGYYYYAFEEDQPTLNTHSADFNGAIRHGGGYGQVYSKTATMLYNLEYVLGEELFLQAIQNYFSQWKIAHPYFEDFRNSVIQFTGVDLNWFFDQWFETTKVIDYSVESAKFDKATGETVIQFKRSGGMQMPIDFEVEMKNGTKKSYHIPNTWFVKSTTAEVLPKWYGWGKLQPTYEARIKVDGSIENIVIDPSNRMADIYMLDNQLKFPVVYEFDHRISNSSDRTKYEVFARPDLWYNGYDGIKGGVHMNGNYLNKFHVFDASFWFNTGLGQNLPDNEDINLYDQASINLDYTTPLRNIDKRSYLIFNAKYIDGLSGGVLGIRKTSKEHNNTLKIFVKSMYRKDNYSAKYLINKDQWNIGEWNNSLNLSYDHDYQYSKGYGEISMNARSPFIASENDYSYLNFSSTTKTFFRKVRLKTRFFAQLGLATKMAQESALYLAGGNPEEMMDNRYTRSAGIFPYEMGGYGQTTGNFHYGGGLNLRGYAGYYAPSNTNPFTYNGTSGAAVNLELEFDQLLPLTPAKWGRWLNIDTYLFADAGMINTNKIGESLIFDQLRADAGIGSSLTIKKFGPLQKVKPLTVRFDMPLFLNRIPSVDPNDSYLSYRWIIAVNRAF